MRRILEVHPHPPLAHAAGRAPTRSAPRAIMGAPPQRGAERTIRAGLPTTVAPAGTSFVTTAPAPTIAASPIVRPGRITAAVPIAARRLAVVRSNCQSLSLFIWPSWVVAAG